MSTVPPPVEFCIEVCQFASDNGLAATVAKFDVTEDKIRRWRRALGYPPLTSGRKRTSSSPRVY